MSHMRKAPDLSNKPISPRTQVHDANVYFRDTQTHHNPSNPNVQTLIQEEYELAFEALGHALYGGEVRLTTGPSPVETEIDEPTDKSLVIIDPGTELPIHEIRDRRIIAGLGSLTLSFTPESIAQTLYQGGKIDLAANSEQ